MITTNLEFAEWYSVFDDAKIMVSPDCGVAGSACAPLPQRADRQREPSLHAHSGAVARKRIKAREQGRRVDKQPPKADI